MKYLATNALLFSHLLVFRLLIKNILVDLSAVYFENKINFNTIGRSFQIEFTPGP